MCDFATVAKTDCAFGLLSAVSFKQLCPARQTMRPRAHGCGDGAYHFDSTNVATMIKLNFEDQARMQVNRL